MGSQQYCLRWNNHQSNMLTVFDQLLESEAFVDVTLACDGLSLKAHKMVLSACSPYFQSLFMDNPCQHPIVILKDVRYSEMKAIVDYMYKGEVNVSQEQLPTLLRTAESLKVKGLAGVTGSSNGVQESPQTNSMPTLGYLLPKNQVQVPLEPLNQVIPISNPVFRPQMNNQDGKVTPISNPVFRPQMNNQDGRVTPPSKRKRIPPRKRSSSDDGNDCMEVLETLVDVHPDDNLSPILASQFDDSQQNEDRDDDNQSVILSDDRSIHDEGSQDEIVTSDIKLEEDSLLPTCLDEINQSILPSPSPSSTPSTSQDKKAQGRKRSWSEIQMIVAITAIKRGHMSINMASKVYKIPAMTLWKRAQSLGIASIFPRRGGRQLSQISGSGIPVK